MNGTVQPGAEAPLFSVVVPVYNVEAFLGECLESIEAQTWRDFEVVLVDDGSTDGSGALLDAFRECADLPVKLVRQPNKGLYLARNAGLRVARGRYVVSLDSDDALAPGALERIAVRIGETDADVVTFEYSRARDFSHPIGGGMEADRIYTGAEARRLLLEGAITNALFMKAFRRDLVEPIPEAGEAPWSGFCLAEDLAYSMRIFDGCRSMAFLAEPLYFYRPNDASISRKADERQLKDLDRATDVLMGYARRWSQEIPDALELARGKCRYMAYNYAEALCVGSGRDESHAGLARLRATGCHREAATDIDADAASRARVLRTVRLVGSGEFDMAWKSFRTKRAKAGIKRVAAALSR
jgi:glycosyltransferase involved in cell wall biosynthesis